MTRENPLDYIPNAGSDPNNQPLISGRPISLRYRVNISRGMKGQVSFEATVDAEGYEMPGVLALSDLLVAELEKRYPAQIGEK